MAESKVYCDDCGLCCEHLLVMPNSLDVLREPRIAIERPLGKVNLPILEASWLLAGPGMPCPFLAADKRCDIYPTRPNECLSFMPGSAKCEDLRKKHGLPPVSIEPSLYRIVDEIGREALEQDAADIESTL